MRKGKRVIAFILMMLMFVLALPVSAYGANTKGGSYGALKWSLKEGTLSITGKGDMPDINWWDTSGLPWDRYSDSIHQVVIGEGVNSIGNSSFYSCSNITKIRFPKTLSRIGEYAFFRSNLEEVTIPNNVVRMEENSIFAQKIKGYSGSEAERYANVTGQAFEALMPAQLSKPQIKKIQSTDGGILIQWKRVSGASRYRVFRKIGSGKWVKAGDTTELSFVDKKVKSGNKYSYSVRCISQYAEQYLSDYNRKGTSIKYIAAPTLRKVENVKNGVRVTWKKSDGAVKYRVYRRASITDKWKKVGETSKFSFVDKKAKGTAKYSYTVSCITKTGKVVSGHSEFGKCGVTKLVSLKNLSRYRYFRKYMSESQLKKAYNEAVKIVKPLRGLSTEEQLVGIAVALRQRFESGMTYSMKTAHYNDPYGYLVLGKASCAGCARTTGLCLDILGIKYEHVNENEYSHQWARVKVGKAYWICDAYGLYCGEEPGVRKHPFL